MRKAYFQQRKQSETEFQYIFESTRFQEAIIVFVIRCNFQLSAHYVIDVAIDKVYNTILYSGKS
jgi:hypothetical protein